MITFWNPNVSKLAAGTFLVLALAACGGGSSNSTAPADTTTGVAAVGAPIVGGTVALKCASGATASTTTGADGSWGVALNNSDYPCSVRVSGGTANGANLTSSLHSVARTAGTTNITPLSDLITGILAGQNPATWYVNATSGDLSGAITANGLSTAVDKLKVALSTLPGKPVLPNDFDPLTSRFSAVKGDAGDDLLESYGTALAAAGLTQTEAAVRTAADQALTQAAYATMAYTTPHLTAFRGGASRNLDGTVVLSMPDPNRGSLIATVQTLDADGNVTALANGGPFSGFVSLFGNRVGQLCAGAYSQYVYVSDELTEVTDITELYGKTFDDYEDCRVTGTGEFRSDGSFVYTEAGRAPDDPDANIISAFTPQGLEGEEPGGTAVLRAKAYKFVANGATRYVYLMVSSRNGSTTPEVNGATDYVLMGVSQ